jgi:rubrerythrin
MLLTLASGIVQAHSCSVCYKYIRIDSRNEGHNGVVIRVDLVCTESYSYEGKTGGVVMATQCTLNHILEMAMQMEIESQHMYSELGRQVTGDAPKDVLRQLVRQEQRHQRVLEQYQRGDLKAGTLSQAQVVDYKIAEHFDQPEISPDMGLKDLFLLAANREMRSHEFYVVFAGLHPAGEAKSLLEELAFQELEHKHKMEDLYTQVAFPQTAGG